MPLSPQDILPAIPRQKVKHIDGTIGKVIGFTGEFNDYLMVKEEKNGKYVTWFSGACELLPEDPREFKVGDNVVATDSNGNVAYTTVRVVMGDGKKILNGLELPTLSPDGSYKFDTGVTTRHATPDEIIKYFN